MAYLGTIYATDEVRVMIKLAKESDANTSWNKRHLREQLVSLATCDGNRADKERNELGNGLKGLRNGMGYVLDTIITLAATFDDVTMNTAQQELVRLTEELVGISAGFNLTPCSTLVYRNASILETFLTKHLQCPGHLGHVWNPHRDLRATLRYCHHLIIDNDRPTITTTTAAAVAAARIRCPPCCHLDHSSDPATPPNEVAMLESPYPLSTAMADEWVARNMFAARLYATGTSSYAAVFVRTVADLLAVGLDVERDEEEGEDGEDVCRFSRVFYPDMERAVKVRVVTVWVQMAGKRLFERMAKGLVGGWKGWGVDLKTWLALKKMLKEMLDGDGEIGGVVERMEDIECRYRRKTCEGGRLGRKRRRMEGVGVVYPGVGFGGEGLDSSRVNGRDSEGDVESSSGFEDEGYVDDGSTDSSA